MGLTAIGGMGRMDLSLFERVQEQLFFLFKYVNDLKEENRELKRRVFSLEKSQGKGGAAMPDSQKINYNTLVEERDHLMMERELIRKKVESVIEKLDDALSKEEAGLK